MEIEAAITEVHHVHVAVVWVNRYALQSTHAATAYARQLEARFAMPVVLVAFVHGRETVFFSPHKDLVSLLAQTPLLSLPWTRYNVA